MDFPIETTIHDKSITSAYFFSTNQLGQIKQIIFRAPSYQAAGADLPDLSTDHVTSIIYSICLQNVLLRVKYPEKRTLTAKCILGILSSPYFFTLNSEHLVLKKHLLGNICFERQNVGIWWLNTMLGKIHLIKH